MKKITRVLLVTLMLLITISLVSFNFNEKTITTSAKKYMEGNNVDLAPRCFLNISSKTKIGKISRGGITCYDESGFDDLELSSSDFQISGGLFKRIKILSISQPRTSDGKVYMWDFNYKATFFGNYVIYLLPSSVTDVNGNGSISSMSVKAKVSLW